MNIVGDSIKSRLLVPLVILASLVLGAMIVDALTTVPVTPYGL